MKSSLKTISLSLLVMALWGSLYPIVKIGYTAFNISANSVKDILMFAGVRFVICGLFMSIYSFLKKEKIAQPKGKNIINIIIIGLFSIVLHYAFIYVGLSTTDSSKAALIKQLGVLINVCSAQIYTK